MKRIICSVILLLTVFCLFSCSPYYTEGDSFFIERTGAVMPVLVRGNVASAKFIVWLHGGPGDTSMAPEKFTALLNLEKEFAMVYWDQRASGMSQGNPSPDTLTIEQFIDDLDILLDTIDMLYDSPDIYLLGVSWGGTLGTAYLADSYNQNRISGWIEVDGGHNMVLMMELSVQWVKDKAAEKIISGTDVGFWQECLDWYALQPPAVVQYSVEAHQKHSSYVRAADGYRPKDSTVTTAPGFDEIFLSSFNFSAFLNSSYLIPNFDIRSLNLNEQMGSITLPVLLIWGAYDGMSPPAMMDNAEAFLGTPPSILRKRLFSESGHNPFSDQPELFAEEVSNFVITY